MRMCLHPCIVRPVLHASSACGSGRGSLSSSHRPLGHLRGRGRGRRCRPHRVLGDTVRGAVGRAARHRGHGCTRGNNTACPTHRPMYRPAQRLTQSEGLSALSTYLSPTNTPCQRSRCAMRHKIRCWATSSVEAQPQRTCAIAPTLSITRSTCLQPELLATSSAHTTPNNSTDCCLLTHGGHLQMAGASVHTPTRNPLAQPGKQQRQCTHGSPALRSPPAPNPYPPQRLPPRGRYTQQTEHSEPKAVPDEATRAHPRGSVLPRNLGGLAILCALAASAGVCACSGLS